MVVVVVAAVVLSKGVGGGGDIFKLCLKEVRPSFSFSCDIVVLF